MAEGVLIMKTTFEVLNKQGNFVTSFSTREEADSYTSKNPEHVVIEKSDYFTLKNFLLTAGIILVVKAIGLIGLGCGYLGYVAYEKLSKNNSKWLSATAGAVTAVASFLVISYAIYG